MALEVYFKDDMAQGIAAQIAGFVAGQLSSKAGPNLASINVMLTFASSLALNWGISGTQLWELVYPNLSEAGIVLLQGVSLPFGIQMIPVLPVTYRSKKK